MIVWCMTSNVTAMFVIEGGGIDSFGVRGIDAFVIQGVQRRVSSNIRCFNAFVSCLSLLCLRNSSIIDEDDGWRSISWSFCMFSGVKWEFHPSRFQGGVIVRIWGDAEIGNHKWLLQSVV